MCLKELYSIWKDRKRRVFEINLKGSVQWLLTQILRDVLNFSWIKVEEGYFYVKEWCCVWYVPDKGEGGGGGLFRFEGNFRRLSGPWPKGQTFHLWIASIIEVWGFLSLFSLFIICLFIVTIGIYYRSLFYIYLFVLIIYLFLFIFLISSNIIINSSSFPSSPWLQYMLLNTSISGTSPPLFKEKTMNCEGTICFT